jgi:hypothetical protein
LNPHVLVMMICSGASHRCIEIRSAICSAVSILGGLHVNRTYAELLIPEHTVECICSVMLDQIGVAVDMANQVGLVAAGIKISMPNLPIILKANGIVSLTDMHGNMNVFRKSFDGQIYRLDRTPHFFVARRRQSTAGLPV